LDNEREIVIWLAGLLSSDGCVGKRKDSKTVRYIIYSTELDWLEKIKPKLLTIDIESTLGKVDNCLSKQGCYFIYLKDPYKITTLLIKHKVSEYMNPRKWLIVARAAAYYASPIYLQYRQSRSIS